MALRRWSGASPGKGDAACGNDAALCALNAQTDPPDARPESGPWALVAFNLSDASPSRQAPWKADGTIVERNS
jgi:hypothetical protein